jgi:AcrR family transcriptional regulator
MPLKLPVARCASNRLPRVALRCRRAFVKTGTVTNTPDAVPPVPEGDEPDQRSRIITAAREIIRETGNAELPMRLLAARAKVSMTLPYALFGSKSGVVAAILASDYVVYAAQRAALHSPDLIEQYFDSMRLAMNFYASDQPFYRALFRMTWDKAHGGSDPTRLNHPAFVAHMCAAREAGLLRPEVDPESCAGVLTDLFSSSVRAWAMLDWDVQHLYAKLGYGYAIAFAGACAAPIAERMHARAAEFQHQLERWRSVDRAGDHL